MSETNPTSTLSNCVRRPRYRALVYDSARWDGFEHRAGDIVISTPPKCGTTWMQMICYLLIFQTPDVEGTVSDLSPWLDMTIRSREEVFEILEGQTHRRFIKTHTPLDGLPLDDRVTYICVGRDPRDACMSFKNHHENFNMAAFLGMITATIGEDEVDRLKKPGFGESVPTPEEWFWGWVDNPNPRESDGGSLNAMLHHFDVALGAKELPNVVVVHYGDLKADLEGEIRRIAGRLGVHVPENLWPVLIEAATFDRMKMKADQIAPDSKVHVWKDNSQFFHSGQGGKWRSFWNDGAQRRYDARVAELVTPEVAAWAHR